MDDAAEQKPIPNTFKHNVKKKIHSLLTYTRILGTLIVIVVVMPIIHLVLRYLNL